MAREVISPDGSIRYRTVLMLPTQAEAFARCVSANSRFTDVLVVPSQKAKTPKFFVTFHPSNTDRQADMYVRQFQARADRAKAEGADYIFWQDPDCEGSWWCFNPKSGETYQVGAFSCTCPDFVYRCNQAGIQCKHQQAWELQMQAGTLGKTDKVTPAQEAETSYDFAPIPEDGRVLSLRERLNLPPQDGPDAATLAQWERAKARSLDICRDFP